MQRTRRLYEDPAAPATTGSDIFHGGQVMLEYLAESILISFCVGGAVGAACALQFTTRRQTQAHTATIKTKDSA